MLRRVGVLPVTIAIVLGATGWLYEVRVGVVGPRIGEALPLDELSRHSSASLAWFVLVWGSAAVLIGLYPRWARLDRTAGALLLSLAVGLCSSLASGVSIAIVRQISVRDALDAAARLHAVYLTAALVGLAVAALARP